MATTTNNYSLIPVYNGVVTLTQTFSITWHVKIAFIKDWILAKICFKQEELFVFFLR